MVSLRLSSLLAQASKKLALTVVDVLRQANITCDVVTVEEQVTSSHAINAK